MRAPIALLFSILFALTAVSVNAQERPNTILVLDGSGSMWGQIDGVNKIVIARDVVSQILGDFPADQNLGLAAYGHRTRGDCTDIELLVPPGLDTREAISTAVNAINPRGKTPMTDAIIAAAEALRFTEEAATVILVSDGIETCNPDPCAAARALEEAGIDFTAHVVGFDVGNDADALAQMQCLAGETGGQFLTAANADELSSALAQVAMAPAPAPEPEPEPAVVTVTFTAVAGDSKTPLDTEILWDINTSGATDLLVEDATGNPLSSDVTEGAYVATAYSVAHDLAIDAPFVAIAGGANAVEVVFPELRPTASLVAPESAPAGSVIQVGWTGPDEASDNVQIAEIGGSYIDYTYTRDGNPVGLQMPATPGEYELRYSYRDRETIYTQPITVTEVEVGLVAPETAAAGSVIQIGWTGPDAASDNIQIAEIGGSYINYTYTREGNPLSLQMPATPGAYELRYVFRDRETIYTQPITVTEVEVGLTAPATAEAGSVIQIGWTGPDADRDNIQIAEIGGSYLNYTYTRDGNPLSLQMPAEPGEYELRYVFQDRETIYTQPISVTKVDLSLDAPASAPAGSTILVGWTGPDAASDNIQVAEIGGNYLTYTYTQDGNPLSLQMPAQPGDYELRYVFQDRETIYTQPISATPVTARLVAPPSAVAGSEVPVGWDGPGYDRDYIAIGLVGDGSYIDYAYVKDGNPVSVTAPEAAGSYELRYVMGQGDTVIATIPLTITQ